MNIQPSFRGALPFFFFLSAVSLFPFALERASLSSQETGFFMWIICFLSLLLSFTSSESEHQKSAFEAAWLFPLHPWQMIRRSVGAHLIGSGIPFGILLWGALWLYDLPGGLQEGLLLGFCLMLPPLSFLGNLIAIVEMGSSGGAILQACLLVPLSMPPLLLGWGCALTSAAGQSPWPCVIGLGGLWCIYGAFVFSFGSWGLKQRILA